MPPTVMFNVRAKTSLFTQPARRGIVLPVVLVVIVLLALGAYTYTETMLIEHEAANLFERQVQARAAVDSAIEHAAVLIDARDEKSSVPLVHNPSLFQARLVRDHENPAARSRYTVFSSSHADPGPRFGLTGESGRIHLNRLAEMDEGTARDILLPVPGMTPELADAILDWIDGDADLRAHGAEDAYYLKVRSAGAKNAPLESLDELLLVRGVTPALLFGEDTNRNGSLDVNENDGDASPPLDDADGRLRRGWTDYVTILSRERNRTADGRLRINVNSDSLPDLFDRIERELGEEAAAFVVGYRLYGPLVEPGSEVPEPERIPRAVQAPPPPAEAETEAEDSEKQVTTPVYKGGMIVNRPPRYRVRSIYDLIGIKLPYVNETGKLMESPWNTAADARDDLVQSLPRMEDVLSISGEPVIEGRIDVNEAPREVLEGVPGMDQPLVESIVRRGSSQAPRAIGSLGELYLRGQMELASLRRAAPFLTTRGDVFRFQVVGYFDRRGPYQRVEAVLDGSARPCRLVALRDLSQLGVGLPPERLRPEANQ